MHAPDGVLPVWLLAADGALTVSAVGWSLARLEDRAIPRVAVVTSAYFVLSQWHVPLGPTSTHLSLLAVTGILLGPAAFLAITVGVVLQALLFGHGGITAIGVNAINMGVPAVLVGCAFRELVGRGQLRPTFLAGLIAGLLASLAAVGLTVASLAFAGRPFAQLATLVAIANLPSIAIDALLAGWVVRTLGLSRPEWVGMRTVMPVPTMPAACGMALLLLAIVPGEAWAHGMRVFAAAEGRTIRGYAYFTGNQRAADATVEVFAPDGTRLAKTVTDANGEFAFLAHRAVDHRIVVDSDDGHRAATVIPASVLEGVIPAGDSSQDEVPSAAGENLAQLVEKAVARQITPLREQLDREAAMMRWRDLLGGVGFILGLFGVWSLARRRSAAIQDSDS